MLFWLYFAVWKSLKSCPSDIIVEGQPVSCQANIVKKMHGKFHETIYLILIYVMTYHRVCNKSFATGATSGAVYTFLFGARGFKKSEFSRFFWHPKDGSDYKGTIFPCVGRYPRRRLIWVEENEIQLYLRPAL
jgi:hypothetical protein